jgi:hypothetical protein
LTNQIKIDSSFIQLYKPFSTGITFSTLFWLLYVSHGWKWPFLKYIFYRPNLNGLWVGIIESDYVNESGESSKPKNIAIVIRQDFLRVHFTTLTDLAVSVSYSEKFCVNKDEGLKNVSYLFRKDTSQSIAQNPQEGATELRLYESKTEKRLIGKYFSNAKTNGNINVVYKNNLHVDTYSEAMAQ